MYKPSTFAERLKAALDYKQMTKAELSRITGISKSSLTRYAKGDWEGKQDAVYAIAQALNLNEAWLMGYEAPMDRTELDRVLEQAKIMSAENQNFLDSHFGVVYGDPERLQVGVSILAQTQEDLNNAAEILMALTVLCRDNRSARIKDLKELTEMISRLPSAKCEAIMDFAKYVVKSQQDN